MELDYKEIGRRVRMRRKELGYTQEYVAEHTGLSVVHISHIETAGTKVSLPALVSIVNSLQTTTDAILCDSLTMSSQFFSGEIAKTIEDCSTWELQVISDSVIALKRSLRKRREGRD